MTTDDMVRCSGMISSKEDKRFRYGYPVTVAIKASAFLRSRGIWSPPHLPLPSLVVYRTCSSNVPWPPPWVSPRFNASPGLLSFPCASLLLLLLLLFAPKAHLPVYPMELKLSELSPSSLSTHRVLKSPRPSLLFCNGTAQKLRLWGSPVSVSIRSRKKLHSIQSSISPSRYKKVATFDPVSQFLPVR
ncbi:hypothetical protein BHE74_00039805 [Ensete ventricosum]|nr:hypothetical protein BHE74_00039805 [Ensete ventricosum]